jgi:2',3'-cyclic-nucleotide 2'-phosphodiesterase (5'-nucleotidase family)
MRLTLLHFNDLHGRLEQLPRLFHLARRERLAAQAQGAQVLLLDGGDSSDQGRWECEVTQGRANYSLLEAMGVQAGVPGNAETLNWCRPALARMVAAVDFPVLGANLVDSADPTQPAVPGLKGSALLDLGGFALGLVGLTQCFPEDFRRCGYGAVDLRAALRREIEGLQAQGARTIVLLSHLGLNGSSPDVLHDEAVAQSFPEISVIVGGHSHSVLEQPLLRGKTIIVQAGDKGRYLGRLDLVVDDATGGVTEFSGRLLPCGAGTPPDPTIQGTLELVIEEAGRLKRSV